MSLIVSWLTLFAVNIFPVVFTAETDDTSNFVVNTTSGISSSLETIKSAIRKYGFDPMVLIDADPSAFQGIANITGGTLAGGSNVTVCGDWSLRFTGDTVRSGGRFCAPKLTGKFNYTDKSNAKYSKCLLDVTLTDVAADMDVLYTQSTQSLSDPRVSVARIGDTQMYLEECGSRIRLSKDLEIAYRTIILQQAVITSVELGKLADESQPVLNFYNKFVAQMKANATSSS